MSANVYEGMFILDSNRFSRDPDGVSGQIAKLIQEAGGEVLVSRMWEERRLAYAIKGHRKGTYWLTYFRIDSESLSALRHRFQLSDSVLRSLFVKVDARIVETLVQHALAGPAALAAQHQAAVAKEQAAAGGQPAEAGIEEPAGKE